jgi:type I restriction enzyme S subunit
MNETVPHIDIRPDHWAIVRDILKKHVPHHEVWAFGSRATWQAKPYSDLDLAIITEQPLSLAVSAELADAFSESDLPWKVDVVDWATTSESFREIIERDKVVVQKGIKSLGMEDESKTTALDSLCELIADCPHSTPVWTTSGVIVLRSQNIRGGRLDLSNPSYTDEQHFQDRIRRAEPTAGDLVITREAPMGEVCEIPPGLRCCLGQRMVLLRPDHSKAVSRYLLFALQSSAVQAQIMWAEGTGSTVSNLRIPDLKKLKIPSPPLVEQRAIAHILGTLDDKIELNRNRNETLEAMARALFKDWFVDFGPVRAKMEGRAPYLPPDLWNLFPDRLDDDPRLTSIWPLYQHQAAGRIRRSYETTVAGCGFVTAIH